MGVFLFVSVVGLIIFFSYKELKRSRDIVLGQKKKGAHINLALDYGKSKVLFDYAAKKVHFINFDARIFGCSDMTIPDAMKSSYIEIGEVDYDRMSSASVDLSGESSYGLLKFNFYSDREYKGVVYNISIFTSIPKFTLEKSVPELKKVFMDELGIYLFTNP